MNEQIIFDVAIDDDSQLIEVVKGLCYKWEIADYIQGNRIGW